MVEAEREGSDRPYEGELRFEGGDSIYIPKHETDPARILMDAQAAVVAEGGYERLGGSSLHVSIPRRGEYPFNEHTTVEDFDKLDQKKAVMAEAGRTLSVLSTEQIREVIEFAKKLKG